MNKRKLILLTGVLLACIILGGCSNRESDLIKTPIIPKELGGVFLNQGTCEAGYSLSSVSNKCITNDQFCTEQYGPSKFKGISNNLGGGTYCDCNPGYKWITNPPSCIEIIQKDKTQTKTNKATSNSDAPSAQSRSVQAAISAPLISPIEPPITHVEKKIDYCCKHCSTGKACGDSCISRSYTCHKGPGCACDY